MSFKHPQELDINDWESLREGETIRTSCGHWKCEDKNDAFTITRIIGGCVYNCYRCGTSGAVFKGSSPTQARKRIDRLRNSRHNGNDVGSAAHSIITLPRDFIPLVTHDTTIPPHAYAWFYRYELDSDDFDDYYIGYSKKLERAIIPIYEDDKLIAWQGRDIYYNRNTLLYNKGIIKKKPLKYYTEYNGKTKLYFKINNNSQYIVLVEDMLSAIKVSKHYKYNVVGLLNSTLHNGLITDLKLRKYDRVFVWLDPDAHLKAVQGCLRWQSMGVNTRCIRTIVDPKEVSYSNLPKLTIQ